MTAYPRKSPWVSESLWKRAKAYARDNGYDFSTDMRDLITAFGDGAFAIDPREVPSEATDRAGAAVYVAPEAWERAVERAKNEFAASSGIMTECIALRYLHGHLRIKRTVQVRETRRIRRNLLNTDPHTDNPTPSPGRATQRPRRMTHLREIPPSVKQDDGSWRFLYQDTIYLVVPDDDGRWWTVYDETDTEHDTPIGRGARLKPDAIRAALDHLDGLD